MIRNKILAIVTAGCLTVSLGVTTLAYTKNVTSKTKVNYSKVQTAMSANSQNNIKSKLDALVKAGTITQTIEDKVIASFNQMDAARKAEMDKLKTMTEAQRKTYFDSQTKTQKIDPLSSLVTDGTLTQAQADAIKAALPHGGRPQGFPGGGMGHRQGMGNPNPTDMGAMMKSKLDTLVTNSTITQAIEDKVIATYNQIATDRKAEMDKLKTMTEAQRKTYMDSQASVKRTNPLTALVTNGTLTQAQADAINKLLPDNHGGPGGPMGFRGHGGRH